MDYETDQGIQEVLRKELNEHGRDRTLVTIAHRLKTIIDYDRVVVMSAGSVLEYVFSHFLKQGKSQQLIKYLELGVRKNYTKPKGSSTT